MIRYSLACAKGHEFEGWFRNSGAFDRQAKRREIVCPTCGSTKVVKAPMAPRIAKPVRDAAEEAPKPAAPEPARPPQRLVADRELIETMRRLRKEVEAKAEYVGPRFAEEARKIHHEEEPARGIYGEASSEEARALADEGIEFYPLPVLPEDHN